MSTASGAQTGPARVVAAVTDLLTPVATDHGYDLEDVEVTPAGKRRILRVVVDCDGGLSLDDVAEMSRAFSAALDATDVMGSGAYVLEVTSPGVDRPLTEPRHWRRAQGRLVRASRTDGAQLAGRLVAADDDGVVVRTDSGEERAAYADLGAGRVEIEFSRAES
jgi:ribosome maturation factor RimP